MKRILIAFISALIVVAITAVALLVGVGLGGIVLWAIINGHAAVVGVAALLLSVTVFTLMFYRDLDKY